MQVKVLFFGVLKDLVGHSEESIQVASGTTLGSLFESYFQHVETLQQRRSSILFARNREFVSAETLIADQDEIAFLPPVSGGSVPDADGNHFSIVRHEINTKQIVDLLKRPEDGAVAVFEGVVRNNTKGRETRYLEYECYEAMALAQMKSIGREIAAKFEVGNLGMVHRLGRLEIGEASVVIVATAPHRKAAFDAAFEAINRLKKEVPIWKKEFFGDGEVWVDGEWDEKLLATRSAG